MVTGIAPNYTSQQLLEMYAWEDFHKDVLNKGKGLDKVIQVIRDTINSVDSSVDCSFKHEKGYVTDLKIFGHFSNFLNLRYSNSDTGLGIFERYRFEWNFVNNLLRGLKRIKNDEAPFLLSDEEKNITAYFIAALSQPPIKYDDDCYLS